MILENPKGSIDMLLAPLFHMKIFFMFSYRILYFVHECVPLLIYVICKVVSHCIDATIYIIKLLQLDL
jgi:hypothetical protein